MSNNSNDQLILKIACFAGRIVLENGGEVYRVEDVVVKIGKFYGLKIECFSALTCIMASGTNKDGEISSLIQRITSRQTNLNKIYILNNILRNMDKYSLGDLEKELIKVYNETPPNFRQSFIGYSLGAASFVFLFKGSFNDFIPAFISGALISIFEHFSSPLKLNNFFINIVGGAICSIVSYMFFYLSLINNVSISIISALMLLVPGVAFINSIRDIIAGDLVSGLSRMTEVVMIGIALAVGAGISLKLLMMLGGGI
ncbi:threonine/serine exporter family protein [Cetobacterium sp. 2A]|uniref:threonine/serine exporter family protein n=1 Tax=unclassified Cetobacterium TaxID=2630983 RepID=UPI00163CD297|nr:threonine/serine exporter family protein [Cetobacterium sp. 2A]MBC2854986.1 threonine/serine exporter family protein [Cetobacterium sp. 2A]